MKWYVLYTRPHHERVVYERLLRKGFEVYLPLAVVWRQSTGRSRKASIPLFARHVFVHSYLEMYAHLELIGIPGVVRLLEDPQGEFLVVPEEEIRILRQLSGAGVPLGRAGYPTEGWHAQVVEGPLRGITGVIREGSQKTLLVPIHALRVSVTVEISPSQVMPCVDVWGRLTPSHCPTG
ncbi:MAG: hypothetical protein HYZ81_03655 [Nitrospinae bacterium]|nr:hypothetical protein [Nitrospinota bacterium]